MLMTWVSPGPDDVDMPLTRHYFVYILSSKHGTLYTGVTNDLARRIEEHRSGSGGFTGPYGVTRLVYWEETKSIRAALEREKQIKAWRRSKKLELIRSANPTFRDLSQDL
jgi:putative endonuclease